MGTFLGPPVGNAFSNVSATMPGVLAEKLDINVSDSETGDVVAHANGLSLAELCGVNKAFVHDDVRIS